MNKIFTALMVMAVGSIAAASANVAGQDKAAVIAIHIPALVVSAPERERATHVTARQLLASPLTDSFYVQALY